jgi:murein DD-endopeptidase MepM/ murein hydrolase activator NlpD
MGGWPAEPAPAGEAGPDAGPETEPETGPDAGPDAADEESTGAHADSASAASPRAEPAAAEPADPADETPPATGGPAGEPTAVSGCAGRSGSVSTPSTGRAYPLSTIGRVFRRLVAVTAGAALLAGCASPRPRDAEAPVSVAASPSPSATAAAPSSPAPGPASGAPGATTPRPAAARYVFPVDGKSGYGREHHDYPATDIIAACGNVVRAVTDGVVAEVSRVDTFDKRRSRGQDRGGLSVSILGDDGVRYYGSHFSVIDDSVRPGVRVAAGGRLGLVGKTGNANNTCHLHLGISPPCAGTADWWIRRGVVWPYPYLDAWRAGQPRSPAAEVRAWHAAHGCPEEPRNG